MNVQDKDAAKLLVGHQTLDQAAAMLGYDTADQLRAASFEKRIRLSQGDAVADLPIVGPTRQSGNG